MNEISHAQAQKWLLSGEALDAISLSRLQAHLENCGECAHVSTVAHCLSQDLPKHLPEKQISVSELRQRTFQINTALNRNKMNKTFVDLFKTVGWVSAAAAFMFVLALIFRPFSPTEPGSPVAATPTHETTPTASVNSAPAMPAGNLPAEIALPFDSPGLLAFESTRDGNFEIYIAEVPLGAEISARVEWNLTEHPANDSEPTWSPDGSKLAFISDRDGGFGNVFVITLKGGELQQLTSLLDTLPAGIQMSSFYNLTWSPDGSLLAANLMTDTGGEPRIDLYLIPVDGSDAFALTDGVDIFPSWSPDGTKLAFTRLKDTQGQRIEDIFLVNPDGSGLENISNSPDAQEIGPAAWLSDGTRLAYFTQIADGLSIQIAPLNGQPTTLNLGPQGANWQGSLALSPTASILAYILSDEHENGVVYLMNADGSQISGYNTMLTGIEDLRWAANGQWLALAAQNGGETQIYLANLTLLQNSDPYAVFPLTFSGQNRNLRWQPGLETSVQPNTGATQMTGPGMCESMLIPVQRSAGFGWPTGARSLSGAPFSEEHPGIDLTAANGEVVAASESGIVIFTGWSDTGLGNMVVLDHGNGYRSLYGHLSSTRVACGQQTGAGEIIGAAGNTGNVSGPTLHFEIQQQQGETWVAVNPLDRLPAVNGDARANEKIEITIRGSERVILRSGPGTTYAQVGEIAGGTVLIAVGISEWGDWLQVQTPVGQMHEGLVWVYRPLTNYESSMGDLPVAQP